MQRESWRNVNMADACSEPRQIDEERIECLPSCSKTYNLRALVDKFCCLKIYLLLFFTRLSIVYASNILRCSELYQCWFVYTSASANRPIRVPVIVINLFNLDHEILRWLQCFFEKDVVLIYVGPLLAVECIDDQEIWENRSHVTFDVCVVCSCHCQLGLCVGSVHLWNRWTV